MRAALALLAALPLLAGDHDFDRMVSHVQTQYAGERVHIPMMGVVNFFSGIGRPFGASDVRLAVFENVRRLGGPAPIEPVGPEWRAIVRVWEKRGDSTQIFAKPIGGDWYRMMVIAVDGDATVISMKIKPDRLIKFVRDVKYPVN